MNPEQPAEPDYNRPVAYDANGQPLYAHPPEPVKEQVAVPTPMPMSQAVHMVRPVDLDASVISPEAQAKHDDARRRYPGLNLGNGEYVITEVKRHPIGLFLPTVVSIFLIGLAIAALFNYDIVVNLFGLTGTATNVSNVILPVLLFVLLVCMGMYIAYTVYANNRLYLTNESIIQDIQSSIFNHRQQTISLGSVEDASYTQDGLVQEIMGYGSICLTTIGNEDTYTFPYVAHPKDQIGLFNNAVESFKNGRRVDD